MKYELQPSLLPVQLLVQLLLHGPEHMQVQVLVQVPEMVLLVELVPVSEQVPGRHHMNVLHELADPQARSHRLGLRLLGL